MNGVTLVTGASGFIGTYLLRQLVCSGARVRAVARAPERLAPELLDRIDVVKGDLRDEHVVEAAFDGVQTVLHLAACAKAWLRDPQEFHDVNVRAVERLLAAAQQAEVASFVHVSTVLANPPYREAPRLRGAGAPTPYETTKRAGERLVESYAASGGHAVIVHPTRVYGPGPLTDANAVTRVVALYLGGRFRVRIADGDVLANYVHAADVATGIRLAAQQGRSGVHYNLGGAENLSFRQFLELVGELSGRRRRTLELPAALANFAAHLSRLWGELGGKASITPGWVRVFLEDRRVDIDSSQRELGYQPRSLRAGLSETIDWLRNGRR